MVECFPRNPGYISFSDTVHAYMNIDSGESITLTWSEKSWDCTQVARKFTASTQIELVSSGYIHRVKRDLGSPINGHI